jgi:DNA-binding PadR family transcriptional regulator
VSAGRDAVDAFLPLPVAVFHILVAIADRERHGYAIMQDIAARTDGRLRLGPGTLYGSIKRMLADGLIEESADRGDPDRDDERRRYYRITSLGRRVAAEESARLAKLLRQARATGLVPKSV